MLATQTREQVRQTYLDDRYQAMLAALVSSAHVSIDPAVLGAITP